MVWLSVIFPCLISSGVSSVKMNDRVANIYKVSPWNETSYIHIYWLHIVLQAISRSLYRPRKISPHRPNCSYRGGHETPSMWELEAHRHDLNQWNWIKIRELVIGIKDRHMCKYCLATLRWGCRDSCGVCSCRSPNTGGGNRSKYSGCGRTHIFCYIAVEKQNYIQFDIRSSLTVCE